MVEPGEPRGSASALQPTQDRATGRRCVLVVEDDPDMQAIIKHVLAAGGYEVVVAGNGAEALARLRSGIGPCLILLDLAMPVMDGYQFRERQLADPLLAALPVIICSACPDLPRRAATLGAVACIDKSFEFEELLRLVDAHSL